MSKKVQDNKKNLKDQINEKSQILGETVPFSKRAMTLLAVYVASRILFTLVVAPVSYTFWNRKASLNEGNIIEKAIGVLDVFDGTQFIQNARESYQWETNHAFFPLFPYIVNRLQTFTQIDLKIIGSIYQLVIGYLTSLILYSLGTKVLKDESLAFKSALIFVFNHSMVYQLALQSELTFAFFTFLGLWIMYRKVKPINQVETVHSKHIMPATFVFGISILARSTGFLMLGFTGLVFLKKTFARSDRFFKIFKYIFYCFTSGVVILLPLGMVLLWKPYEMHCETKLDRTDAIPKWCLDEIPNVYNYIQKVYWDVKFMGFLHRKPEFFFVALPMNVFLFYTIYRFAKAQGWNFFTFGLFSIREKKQHELMSFYENPALITFVWHFLITMFMIIFMANIDINSRIASTNVLYYWGFANLIDEYQRGTQTRSGKFVTVLMMLHNLIYMMWNCQWFLLEASFW
eukprot:403374170